jgi:hypothetical protein
MVFLALWVVDIAVALIVVAFFFIGIADGSVSSFNIVLWIGILAGVALVVFGSRALRARGNAALAIALAAVLAVPALLYGLLLVIAITSGVRWN